MISVIEYSWTRGYCTINRPRDDNWSERRLEWPRWSIWMALAVSTMAAIYHSIGHGRHYCQVYQPTFYCVGNSIFCGGFYIRRPSSVVLCYYIDRVVFIIFMLIYYMRWQMENVWQHFLYCCFHYFIKMEKK